MLVPMGGNHLKVLAWLSWVVVLRGEEDAREDACGVAICFSGHLRTFASHPALREATRRNLVEATAPEGGCAHRREGGPSPRTTTTTTTTKGVDVFGYVSLEAGSGGQAEQAEQEGLRAFHEIFNPKRVETAVDDEGGLNFTDSRSTLWASAVPAPTEAQMNRLPTYMFRENPWAAVDVARVQYSKVAASYALAQQYEREERGVDYAWFVRARFDTVWFRPLTPPARFPADRVWVKNNMANGVHDMFALVPRHLADAFFGAAESLFAGGVRGASAADVCELSSEQGKGGDAAPSPPPCSAVAAPERAPWWAPELMWQPEALLWHHLRTKGVPFGRASIPMVHLRDHGPQCVDANPWANLLSALQVAVGFDYHGPGGTFLSSVFKRAFVALCAREVDRSVGLASSYLELPHDDIMRLEKLWDPGANAQAVARFCAERDAAVWGNHCVEDLTRSLWQVGVPLPPPGEATVEGEIFWTIETLLSRFGMFGVEASSTAAMVHAFEFEVKAHDDPAERELQPPSRHRVLLTSDQATSLIQSLACVYLWMQGLVVAKDNSADWPSPAQGEACVGTLHDLEVAVFATQLDDGLLTRPTWDRTDFLTVSYDGVVTPDPDPHPTLEPQKSQSNGG